jgi:arylsulfatase A-like enzyme
MKNLVILHLESISRQRLASFAAAFPNTRRLMERSRVYDNYFSSATSTLMVVTYLWHGNDFEFDAASEFEGMRPAGNNRNLFSLLHDHGYRTGVVCLNAFHTLRATELSSWPDDLPPVWGTNEFPEFYARFDALTDTAPFALYVWDLVTHIEHSLALAPYSDGLTDQVRRACAVADEAVGELLAILERKGLLANTTIVMYGDHGDDFWTHGFKGGLIHGTEPYADVLWSPLAILDPTLPAGHDDRMASTVDLGPTCLALLGIDGSAEFAFSGSPLAVAGGQIAFAQNFTASQPDNKALGIAKTFAAIDATYALLASSRGLELYAHRLDPGNHCNLLRFFELGDDGRLVLAPPTGAAAHFRRAFVENARAVGHVTRHFGFLRSALLARVAAKRAYVVEREGMSTHALDSKAFDTVNRAGDDLYFGRGAPARSAAPAMAGFDFSYKLK